MKPSRHLNLKVYYFFFYIKQKVFATMQLCIIAGIEHPPSLALTKLSNEKKGYLEIATKRN